MGIVIILLAIIAGTLLFGPHAVLVMLVLMIGCVVLAAGVRAGRTAVDWMVNHWQITVAGAAWIGLLLVVGDWFPAYFWAWFTILFAAAAAFVVGRDIIREK